MSSLQLALLPDPDSGPSLQQLAHRNYQAQLRLARLRYVDPTGLAKGEAAAVIVEAESERDLTATALLLSIPNQRCAIVGAEDEQRYWVIREHGNHLSVAPYRLPEPEDPSWALPDALRADLEEPA